MKKLAIVVAWCGSLICSPVQAKTFVGVLWPLFGAPAAPGLVEFVADLKTMPDVEVSTYPFESWQALGEEIERQPAGTHTVVIGYSLGANNAVRLANQAKYIDLVIALQPSMMTSTPAFTGNVGRFVEFYNPNPLMTFGGMGSHKLVGAHIEYIANNDNHIGAPFNTDFRNFAKTEIAKFAADNGQNLAQAKAAKPVKLAQLPPPAEPQPTHSQKEIAQKEIAQKEIAQKELAQKNSARKELAAKDHTPNMHTAALKVQKPDNPEPVAQEPPKQQIRDVAFLNGSSSFFNSGAGSDKRQLTVEDLSDYVKRTYGGSSPAGFVDSSR